MSKEQIYIDGEYFTREKAKISVYDHGLLYGDGVFEGIRIYNGTIFKLKEHLERLYESAAAILLSIPLSIQEMEEAVIGTVEMNKRTDGYIRLIITRGEGDLGLDPSLCRKATIIIIADDIQLYPEEFYQKGISIITASTRRIEQDSLDPRIKSLNYLNNIMAKMEAKQAGCLEAVMLNKKGHVTECTGDNIFIMKNNELYTPDRSSGILEGITRQTVIDLAKEKGIPVKESVLTLFDLYTGDECFLTGSGAELIPVVSIDGRKIGNGQVGRITLDLMSSFRKLFSG